MAAQKPLGIFRVNLLNRRDEEEKLMPKLIKWALSSGKFIAILVELITICAFVYRYKLDADLASLTEQINNKVTYINSLNADKVRIKQLQFQLSTISKLKSEKTDYISSLTEITKLVPKDIKLTNVTLDQTQSAANISVSISGETPSNIELSAFIEELQKSPDFSNVVLSDVEFDDPIKFTITSNLIPK